MAAAWTKPQICDAKGPVLRPQALSTFLAHSYRFAMGTAQLAFRVSTFCHDDCFSLPRPTAPTDPRVSDSIDLLVQDGGRAERESDRQVTSLAI
jgi:hypothetical protein